MATSTPYLNLVKPAYSETADIGVLNENADIIDQAVSAQAQAIAGKPDDATEMPLGSNDTTPVSQVIANLQNEIGIVCTGNTCAISASTGQYVVLKNSTISGRADGLYTAAKTIPANTVIDSTYLTPVSGGGLNDLKGQVDALNSKLGAYAIESNTLETIQSLLVSYAQQSMSDYEIKNIAFFLSTASTPFLRTAYIGTMARLTGTRLVVNVQETGTGQPNNICGIYRDGTWAWKKYSFA